MSDPRSPCQIGGLKFARISHHALAAILTRLVKDAMKNGGIVKIKLKEALFAVKEFQALMLDAVALTGRHGHGATEVFMTVSVYFRVHAVITNFICQNYVFYFYINYFMIILFSFCFDTDRSIFSSRFRMKKKHCSAL
jgi:hypothetical protein